MAKQLISIRVSDATRAKLDILAVSYGTQTEAIAVAIDRLHNEQDTISSGACRYCDVQIGQCQAGEVTDEQG